MLLSWRDNRLFYRVIRRLAIVRVNRLIDLYSTFLTVFQNQASCSRKQVGARKKWHLLKSGPDQQAP